jgi:hypothetical protein
MHGQGIGREMTDGQPAPLEIDTTFMMPAEITA